MNLGLNLSASDEKVRRAREHLKSLDGELAAFRKDRYLYSYRVGEIDPDTGWADIWCIHKQVPELCLGIVIGDIVHNLRCAMDYIVAELVEKSPGAVPYRRHQFPIQEKDVDYDADIGTGPVGNGQLRGVVYGLAEIRKLQPFSKNKPFDTHPLWLVKRFCDADKHRIITTTIGTPKEGEVRFGEGVATDVEAYTINIAQPAANVDYKVGRARFANSVPSNPNPDSFISVGLWFGTPPFDGKDGVAVPPAMFYGLCEEIKGVVEVFKAL